MPLFAAKAAPGLFPPTAAARQAAQRCRDEGMLRVVSANGPGRARREMCTLTEKGMAWLLSQSSPREVLEDFVRVLEERQQQAADLVNAARALAASIDSLKSAVERLPGAPGPNSDDQLHHAKPLALRESDSGCSQLTADILAYLEQWHSTAPGECPLPELYRGLHQPHAALTVGQFHDGLRELYDQHRVYPHPRTGPLYQLPEPPFALLIGHVVAYYASTRT